MRLAEGSETWLLLFLVEPHILLEVLPIGSHLFDVFASGAKITIAQV
jgi:hypothetical protein